MHAGSGSFAVTQAVVEATLTSLEAAAGTSFTGADASLSALVKRLHSEVQAQATMFGCDLLSRVWPPSWPRIVGERAAPWGVTQLTRRHHLVASRRFFF